MNDLHPGDKALSDAVKRFPALYGAAMAKCEKILEGFLKPKDLQPLKDEKAVHYQRRVMRYFSGPRWLIARRKLAAAVTNADMKASDYINDVLQAAFVAGFNESAYAMSLTGVHTWPVTASVAAALIADGIVTLSKRVLKKGKDTAYNEQKIQSAVHSAIMRGLEIEKYPKEVSKSVTKARQNESISAARASIYGASDTGAYFLGHEAQNMGIDVEKTWLGIMDIRIRPSHRHLHGETVALDNVFHGYYSDLRYPHDPQAHPKEIMRCRCRMAVHVKGKSPGEYSRTILPTETSAYKAWRDARIREAGGELELLKLHKKLGR